MEIIIGIMGPGEGATPENLRHAEAIGCLCAKAGYTVMTGGRSSGVMDAGLKGAKSGGGKTVGILPFKSKSDASQYADVVIVTNMGSARNYINALTSDVMVVCGIGAGTLSEVALAMKDDKPIVFLSDNQKANEFLGELGKERIVCTQDIDVAFSSIQLFLRDAAA